MNVRIFKPSKSSTQSGRAKGDMWVIEPELVSARTPEPLMGWVASKDTLNQIKLSFKTLEDAKTFAAAKGWSFTVTPEQRRKLKPRNYADNIKYIPPEEPSSTKVP